MKRLFMSDKRESRSHKVDLALYFRGFATYRTRDGRSLLSVLDTR